MRFWNAIKLCGKPRVRRWTYRVSAASLSVAATYGVIDGNKSAALLLLFAAIFGIADANVSEE